MTRLALTRDILADLIAYPTISTDSNMAMIDYMAAYLTELGARVDVYQDETGTKANMFATLGPDRDGGLVLSGHSDVVPVADQDWTTDPFTLDERDGKLFGRGACDMKGFIAATLALAPVYAKMDLKRPIHFSFTHDEETGCLGASAMIPE
ncbi:MAG: acetylornithine deacetylase ArgE, partial [Pseudomonadota bacterium]